jgi:hypothetical protein
MLSIGAFVRSTPASAGDRMASRERPRLRLRCLTAQLRETEIDDLVRNSLLKEDTRSQLVGDESSHLSSALGAAVKEKANQVGVSQPDLTDESSIADRRPLTRLPRYPGRIRSQLAPPRYSTVVGPDS